MNIKKVIFNPRSLGFIVGLILYLTQIPIRNVASQTLLIILQKKKFSGNINNKIRVIK